MKQFAELAEHGCRTLDAGTAAEHWPALMDEAFNLRRQIWNITDVDSALVQAGQRVGAGVAFAGSGGAVVGVVSEQTQLDAAAQAYQAINTGFLVLNPGASS